MDPRTAAQQREEPGAGGASAWERFNAHTPRYRLAMVLWVVSIVLIPASIPLHSAAVTAATLFLTWVAIVFLRRADLRERLAQGAKAPDEPAPTSADTTRR